MPLSPLLHTAAPPFALYAHYRAPPLPITASTWLAFHALLSRAEKVLLAADNFREMGYDKAFISFVARR